MNLKNQKGITMIALVITVIILTIIGAFTLNIVNNSENSSIDLKEQAELRMVQQAILERYTKYTLTKDENILVGDKITFNNEKDSLEYTALPEQLSQTFSPIKYDENMAPEECYYLLENENDLNELGIDNTENKYIVNYYTGEAMQLEKNDNPISEYNKYSIKQTSEKELLYTYAHTIEKDETIDLAVYITFADGENKKTIKYAKGDTFKSLPNINKEGHRFLGWYTEVDRGTKIEESITVPDKDTTYYAQWDIYSTLDYKVQHYKEGLDGKYILAEEEIKEGEKNTIVTATAKTFIGFEENTTHKDRIASGTIVEDGTLVLMLYYTRKSYNITYELHGGINEPDAQTTYKYGEEVMLGKARKPGYTFTGWYTNKELTGGAITKIEETETEGIEASDITLYAHWTLTQYTITCKNATKYGGDNLFSKSYTIEDNTFELDTPKKTGYVFQGWTDVDSETATPQMKIEIPKGTTGNKTYYAHWEKEDGIVPIIRDFDTKGLSTSTVTSTETKLVRNDNESTNIIVDGVQYETAIYYFPEDATVSSTLTLGDTPDVASSSTALTADGGCMVVAIFEKNLTIESTGMITAYNTSYGGPKGMYICVRGTLTNNGTISMTARGANAVGEDVNLYYSNKSPTWEYVPAAGAGGGAAVSVSGNTGEDKSSVGKAGNSGTNRATGGGGSGGTRRTNIYKTVTSGAGASGTSYSGGSGGGRSI